MLKVRGLDCKEVKTGRDGASLVVQSVPGEFPSRAEFRRSKEPDPPAPTIINRHSVAGGTQARETDENALIR